MNSKNIEIKNIPNLPDEIVAAINNKKLAVFIGAGVSRFIGCKGWDELAKNLVKKCAEQKHIKPITKELLLKQSDQVKLISICYSIFNDKSDNYSFMEEMKKSLKDSKIDEFIKGDKKFKIYKDFYKDLKNIGNIFITTNADRFIDNLLDKININIKDFNKRQISNHRLYKIHGCISDEDSLVFTKNKYITTYTNNDFIEFIQSVFAQYKVLFVGYGLNEFELLHKIFGSYDKNKEPRHFYLKGYYQHEQELCNLEHNYFSNLGIRLVPFEKDENSYEQLIHVIDDWNNRIFYQSKKIPDNCCEIDKALENPYTDVITTIVQNIDNDKVQYEYFFQKASQYQQLSLWLESLYEKKYFTLDKDNQNRYWCVLSFLEAVSIQNRNNEIEKVKNLLLTIANSVIKYATDDHVVYGMVKIIFNLPANNITLEHIDFIESHIRKYNHNSILDHEIERIVIPVLVDNQMHEHMLRLLTIIFGYTFNKKSYGSEVTPIIEQYWLDKLLNKYSGNIIELIGLSGLKIVISLLDRVIQEYKDNSDILSIATIRQKTKNEISQSHNYSRQYEQSLVFFIRDLLENLSNDEVKPCIEEFLLEDKDSIFQRIALHIINCKYDDLKRIFWQWWDNPPSSTSRIITELWTLLKERSNKFSQNEVDKIISWIEGIDRKEYYPDGDDEIIKKANAYQKKRWLLCLKDNNSKARELYQKYESIESEGFDGHPEFNSWFSGVYTVPQTHPVNLEELCKHPITAINNFDPSKYEKRSFQNDEDLIEDVGKDLVTCVIKHPKKFSDDINTFKHLDYVYKNSLIGGFSNAWRDKKKFDWKNILNFVNNELTPNFFNSKDNKHKKWFISTVADLIMEGTKKDDNAFSQNCLPITKKIIFNLLINKYEEQEDDIRNSLDFHVLNSCNGRVLQALIYYALRYGRLNSSQSIKWEDDVKLFFTEQLNKNDVYSLLVFTILGQYLHQLQFLDKEWVKNNFNKIFPIKNKRLWEVSITAYFFNYDRVYEDVYILFKNKQHIKQVLKTHFEDNYIKNNIISFMCIAYMNDIDSNTIFDIVKSKNKDNILYVINSIVGLYGSKQNSDIRNKVKKIWNKIYKTYKNNNSGDINEIFEAITKWFIFISEIEDSDMPLLIYTAKYTKGDFNSYKLIEEMSRLSEKYPNKIGKIYKSIVENDKFPSYKKELIIKILNNLNEQDKTEIINYYSIKGIFIFNDVYEVQKN